MRPLARFGFIAIAAATIGAVALACATEGESDPPEEPRDGGVPKDAADAIADAGREADVEIELPACTDAGMCRVAAPIDTRINVTSIRGSGADDVWAVGSNRTVLHYDGTRWEKTAIEDDASSPYTMRAVWLSRADDVWILDGPNLRHAKGWAGGATEWASIASEEAYVPSTIDGRDGTLFIGRLTTSYGPTPLVKCGGWDESGLVSPEYLGDGTSASDGIETLTMPLATEAWATIGPSDSAGRVVRIFLPDGDPDGGPPPSWTVEEHDSRSERSLYGVWGNADAIWLVGESGLIRRMKRSAIPTKVFEIIPSPVTADLRGVFGFATDDVWAVGDESTVLHWDGEAWTKIATPFDAAQVKPRLLSVWGSAKDDVWIGGNAVMLHIGGRGP